MFFFAHRFISIGPLRSARVSACVCVWPSSVSHWAIDSAGIVFLAVSSDLRSTALLCSFSVILIFWFCLLVFTPPPSIPTTRIVCSWEYLKKKKNSKTNEQNWNCLLFVLMRLIYECEKMLIIVYLLSKLHKIRRLAGSSVLRPCAHVLFIHTAIVLYLNKTQL